ncbi:MAG: hypothetical protein ACK5TQ_15925 [Acetobacteraceae bacterium]
MHCGAGPDRIEFELERRINSDLGAFGQTEGRAQIGADFKIGFGLGDFVKPGKKLEISCTFKKLAGLGVHPGLPFGLKRVLKP